MNPEPIPEWLRDVPRFEAVGGALLVNGTDPPVLEAEEPLIVIPTVTGAWPPCGETLYNADGEAVAWVTGVHVTPHAFESASFYDAAGRWIPSDVSVKIEASGFGFEMTDARGFRLIGRRA